MTFSNKTVTYDGSEHSIVYGGTIPAGTSVEYTNNAKTNAGVYNASVRFSNPNYNEHTLSATLTINKAEITGMTLTGTTVEYDTRPHSITVVGNLPSGAIVTYYYNNEQKNSVTEVGTYTVRAVLSGANYVEYELTATLKITSTEKQLYSAVANGTIYFQNDLDGDKLYKASGNSVTKVNNDVPQYMSSYNGTLYYYSSALLGKTIKSYSGSVASNLYSTKGEYLTTDGTYIYYAINNTLVGTDENGIYKYALSGKDAQPVRLTSHKAEYIAYYNNNIYFSDKDNHGYLSSVSISSSDQTPTQLYAEKAEYILVDNDAIYFNSVADTLGTGGSAIRKYNISNNSCIKLTTDAGKYLTKIDSYVYYVCDDLLTGNLFGKNIRKVSAMASKDNNIAGDTVISDENNGYSSLTSNGDYLYYYKLNDKHFYQYNTKETSDQETDLMKGFTVTPEAISLDGYSSIATYKGEIYFTDSRDGSALYKYNPTTNATTKVLSDSVANVWFNGDTMYYSTFISVDYASFKLDMKTGESTKLSSDRWENLIFDGNDIYYLHVKSIVGNNAISKMGETAAIYNTQNVSINNLVKIDNTFYFIVNPKIFGKQKLYKFTIGEKDATDLNTEAEAFVISGNNIYYYDGDTNLKKCDLDGKNATTIATNVEITNLYENDGKIYYTSVKSGNVGLYSYNTSTDTTSKISDKIAHGIVADGNNLYFINTSVTYTGDYPNHKETTSGGTTVYDGDGALYCYDGNTVTKKA